MSEQRTIPLIVIVGETASGKTAAAIEAARYIRGEIICADSRTVYKGMNIGTAKPSKDEQHGVPHHLLDVVRPDEHFSAAEFKKRAQNLIEAIWQRGNFPFIVGGTGLYIDSVIFDFDFGSSNLQLRQYLERLSNKEIVAYATTNKISIEGIEPNNKRHLVRALERGGVQKQALNLRPNTLVVGIQRDKEELRKRIHTRVDSMFANGFIGEVKGLAKEYGWDNEALSGIGYRAAKQYVDGEVSIEEVKAAFKKRDLGLAKRQRTWFKRNPHIQWFNTEAALINRVVQFGHQQV